MKVLIRVKFLLLMFAMSIMSVQALEVSSYYGEYKTADKVAGRAATSLTAPVNEQWVEAAKANKKYNIAVLIPHLKDPYWLAINYGVMDAAKRLNVNLKLLVGGGYQKAGVQRKQLNEVLDEKWADGVVLASVYYDRLDFKITEYQTANIPVVEVVNDIQAQDIAAKALVSFYDMGYFAGKYVVEHSGDKPAKVAFFPGPKGSGWAPDTLDGFKSAIKDANAGSRITILDAQFGDTGAKMQTRLLNYVLEKEKVVDYLVGNAVMAMEAPKVLEGYAKKHANTKIISTYIIPSVYQLIADKKVLAAPSDVTVEQGRMAVDMLVRILNGEKPGDKAAKFPFRAGPVIPVVNQDNIADYSYESLFGSKDFEKTLEHKAK